MALIDLLDAGLHRHLICKKKSNIFEVQQSEEQ
jgi:Fe2+ or Zn2+ uptake regulation protein